MPFQIPTRWEQWAKTLVGGAISGGANAVLAALGLAASTAVGLPTHQLDRGQMIDIFASGALVGAFMFLKQSPVPPDTNGTQFFTPDKPPVNPPKP